MSRSALLLRRGSKPAVNAGPKPAVPANGHGYFGMISENTSKTHAKSWADDVATLGVTPAYSSNYNTKTESVPNADILGNIHSPMPGIRMQTWFGWPDSEVNAGSHDAAITAAAQAFAALGTPIFLRWDIEMNITSYGYETDGSAAGGPTFISAWRRVYNLFQAAGATNVAFVWCPNSNSPFDPNSWRPYYPGDAYVDWIGVDSYNWGNSNLPSGTTFWESAYQDLRTFVADWKANFGGLTAGKPLMLGEGSCYDGVVNGVGTPGAGGGVKSWWFTDWAGYLISQGFKAATLFNTNQSGSKVNWRMDSSSAAGTQSIREILNDPYFGGTSTVGSGYAAAVAADTPYAWWKLNDASGNPADSSGNGFTATANGTALTYNCPGRYPGAGRGLSWYGGYLDLGSIGTFGSSMGAGFTVEFRYKDGNYQNPACTILGQLETGTTESLAIYANTGHALGRVIGNTTFFLRNVGGTSRYAEISTNIYDGFEHHIVWVCRPGVAGGDVVYVDGVAQTLFASNNPTAGSFADFVFHPFLGGRNNRGSIDQPSVGVVSNLALYKGVLSPTRVAAHWSALTT